MSSVVPAQMEGSVVRPQEAWVEAEKAGESLSVSSTSVVKQAQVVHCSDKHRKVYSDAEKVDESTLVPPMSIELLKKVSQCLQESQKVVESVICNGICTFGYKAMNGESVSTVLWSLILIPLPRLMVPMCRRRLDAKFQILFRILKALLFLGFMLVMIFLFVLHRLTISDLFAAILAFTPTGWGLLLVGQVCRPLLKRVGFWDSLVELARAYDYIMGLIVFLPITVLSWIPVVSELQTRMLFHQAFSRDLQISMILAGRKEKAA